MIEELDELQDSPELDGDQEAETTEEESEEAKSEEELTVDDYKKLQEKADKLEKANKDLYQRAKKAEAKAKEVKAEPLKNNAEQEDKVTKADVEILFLQDKGLDDEEIQQLRKIQAGEKATGKSISLIEAQKDPLFVAYKERKGAEDKKRKAQLGASGGGGSAPKEKKMTNEEHKTFAQTKAQEYLANM